MIFTRRAKMLRGISCLPAFVKEESAQASRVTKTLKTKASQQPSPQRRARSASVRSSLGVLNLQNSGAFCVPAVRSACSRLGWQPMSMEKALRTLVEELEQDRSLRASRNLRRRSAALGDLEVCLSVAQLKGTTLHQRAKSICAELESINFRLYNSIRREIQQGAGREILREWMSDWNDPCAHRDRNGYDYLDELVSGILQLEEPSPEVIRLDSEMVAYQPTPARHIFDFINRVVLTERDSLIDLGSGLGHVTLIASVCASARCIGIELEPSYVECALKCAQSLKLTKARFIQGDVRAADLYEGTVFYLYTPFVGTILRDVLRGLRLQSRCREIRIATFGPCTPIVAEEHWLVLNGPLTPDRVAIFLSRS
jgi:Methyltransferase domain